MQPPLDEARTLEALDAALRSTAADEFEISVLARSGEYTRFAGQEEFRTFGYPCGKGEPKQWGFLSHGAAPLLARGIRTGVA